MRLNEFKECVEKVRKNIDKFINQIEINDELIKTYIQISGQAIEELKRQEEILKKYQNDKLIQNWTFHLKENRKYGFEELAKEIENKLNEYDLKLKEMLEEKEKEREEILKANKRK